MVHPVNDCVVVAPDVGSLGRPRVGVAARDDSAFPARGVQYGGLNWTP